MISSEVSAIAAIDSRRSVRAFLPAQPEREVLEAIFAHACRAPSGSNIQPWRVHVLTGQRKVGLSGKILAVFGDSAQDALHQEEHAYYPKIWRTPFIERRRALGWGLYSLLGIGRDDKSAMRAQLARNFDFFDAPVGVLFTTDRSMERGSWLDLGMFLQNVMLMARVFGLDSCPQAAFNKYHRIVSEHLALPENEVLVCAMSLGYADDSKIENSLESVREPVRSFVEFHD